MIEVRQLLSATTSITVSASVTSVVFGQSETLTAIISSSAGTPNGGSVTFYSGTTPLGSQNVNNGIATLTTNALAIGANVISATYSGNGTTFAGSSSQLSASSIIDTVAGNGDISYSGDGGTATEAQLSQPYAVAVDAVGDLYIADSRNSRVREVNAITHVITTIAGTYVQGYNGDGILATAAELNDPTSIAIDAAGDVFIADSGNSRIRQINVATHTISTVAGTGYGGFNGDGVATTVNISNSKGIALDAAGDLFIADSGNDRIREVDATTHIMTTIAGTGTFGYNGDGIPATLAEVASPVGIAVDSAGNVFIADGGDDRVREVNATTHWISTVAGTGAFGYNGDGIAATSAKLFGPSSIAVDTADDVFIADSENGRVREVNASTHQISTVAGTSLSGYNGDGITATAAELYNPCGVVLDANGNLFIADSNNNRIREVDASTHQISTVAGNGVIDGNVDGTAATNAEFNYAQTVIVDSAGDLFIADSADNRVREVNAVTHLISTIAGTGVDGYNGDRIAATAAELSYPEGLALDAAGDLFIADSGNNRIREVNGTTHIITTVAGSGHFGYSGDGSAATIASLADPWGVAVDSSGDLFIADSSNNCIREVNASTHVITTVAGTGAGGYNGDGILATTAQLDFPSDVVVDSTGNLFISDSYNYRIREVNATTRQITTVAGTGNYFYNGDGIAATSANLWEPMGIALDAAGDLFIADYYNCRIREVNANTQQISTVVGSGGSGFSTDGTLAAAAHIDGAASVAVDQAGNVYYVDYGYDRVRVVTSAFVNVTLATPITPKIEVTCNGGMYNENPYAATGTITGVTDVAGSTLENVGLTFTYYSGSTASGTPLSSAPSNVGTYTVVASFAGSADYSAASTSATFQITAAPPTIQVADNGGVFNGSQYSATASISGINGSAGTTLEGVGLTLTYYSGTTATGAALSGPPTTAGTFTVVATFAGSTDYASASNSTTFTISKATPIVTVTDAGGPFDGTPYSAIATITGVNGIAGTTLEGVGLTLTYFAGAAASGPPLPEAPAMPGTYTVLVSFAGSNDFVNVSRTTTFVIGPSIYGLDANKNLVIIGTSTIIDTNVTKFGFASNGDLVDLNNAGQLKEQTAAGPGNWSVIDTNVADFRIQGVMNSGIVVDLHNDGSLWAQLVYLGAVSKIDINVIMFAIAGNGDVVDLHSDRSLHEFTAYGPVSSLQIDGGVTTFAIAGNGDVVDLHETGALYEFTAYRSGAAMQIDGGVTRFAIAGNSDVVDLHGTGALYEFTAYRSGAAVQIDGGVTGFAIAGNGDVVDLHRSGALYEFTAFRNGAAVQIDGGVTGIAIAGNGDVVDLHGAGALNEFTAFRSAASYLQIDGGVTRFAIASNGFVEDQHFSGLMYIQTYFRSLVSQSISQFT